ncbi:MAG: hypothetical protein AAF702_17365 [Chloroflexota bacterium]
MRENIRTKLLNEVATTLSPSPIPDPELEFPLAGWLWRLVENVSIVRFGPSLTAAAMGAAATILLIFIYPTLFPPSSAKVTVLDTPIQDRDNSILVQRRRSQLVAFGSQHTSTMEVGDQLFSHSSNLLIEFVEGWKSTVQPGTVLEIERLNISGKRIDVTLLLIDGEIRTEIDRNLGYNGTINIRTKSEMVQAIGTTFVVRSNSENSSYFAVFSGRIQVSDTNDGQTKSLETDEHLVVKDGQWTVFKNQPEVISDPDLTNAYVTAAWSDVALYAGPDYNTSKLGSLPINAKMELVGTTADQDWYVVCCIFSEVLTWVDVTTVTTHNVYDNVPRFSDELLRQYQKSSVADSNPGQLGRSGIDSDKPIVGEEAESKQPGEDTVKAKPDKPEVTPTETIAATSTAIATPTSRPSYTNTPSARPRPPEIEPEVPTPILAATVESPTATTIPTATNLPEGSASSQEPAAEEAQVTFEPTPSNTPTFVPNNSSNDKSDDRDDAPVATAIPTNTLIPPTNTTRPPSTSRPTDTPIPPVPTQILTLEPTPTYTTEPTSLSQPTNTPNSPALTPTHTVIVTAIVPTPLPTPTNTLESEPTNPPTDVPVSPTPVPTATLVPPTPMPTSTPMLVPPTFTPAAVATDTVEAVKSPAPEPTSPPQIVPPTNTPAIEVTSTPNLVTPIATEPVHTDTPEPQPTATPQIIVPTNTAVPNATSTPNPKLTVATEPPANNTPEVTDTPDTPVPTSSSVPSTATSVPKIVVPTPTVVDTPTASSETGEQVHEQNGNGDGQPLEDGSSVEDEESSLSNESGSVSGE